MDIKTIFEKVLKLEFRVDNNDKRLTKIEGNSDKVVWIVVTAIIVAVLSLVIGK